MSATATPEPLDPRTLTEAPMIPPAERDLGAEDLERIYPKNDYSKVPETTYANCPGCGYKFLAAVPVDPAAKCGDCNGQPA